MRVFQEEIAQLNVSQEYFVVEIARQKAEFERQKREMNARIEDIRKRQEEANRRHREAALALEATTNAKVTARPPAQEMPNGSARQRSPSRRKDSR